MEKPNRLPLGPCGLALAQPALRPVKLQPERVGFPSEIEKGLVSTR
ncbi:MAG: hypothetical protein LBU47_06420 [Christensenellaceae bacterium]|nr:hypothetical protein [Christensenellaceae bacterium]